MNKYLPILICAAAAVMMAAGISRSRAGAEPAGTESSVAEAPGVRHYDNADHVRVPAGTPSQEKDYEGFRLSFNKDNHTPNWVAWELLGDEAASTAHDRSNKFWQDAGIEGCPSTDDYRRSGFDRGHMCPAADQKWSAQAMSDCFVLSNMCPQDHALNGGAWNTLENKERAWARRDSAIVIVAGPIYTKDDRQTIGSAGVRVPGAFFKVMAAPYVEQPRGIAFIYPNMSSPGDMRQYVTTIDEVEKLTGFDFCHALPDDIERTVESASSFEAWNRR